MLVYQPVVAALEALDSVQMNSKLVWNCVRARKNSVITAAKEFAPNGLNHGIHRLRVFLQYCQTKA